MTSQEDEFLRQMTLQEGALIEISVLDTSYEDWKSTISHIVEAGWPTSLTRHDEKIPVSIYREMFTEGEDIAYTLQVDVGRQLWTTQFYSLTAIDFQGNPAQLANRSDIDDLRIFMSTISQATRKPVRLIPETIDIESVQPYFEISPGESP